MSSPASVVGPTRLLATLAIVAAILTAGIPPASAAAADPSPPAKADPAEPMYNAPPHAKAAPSLTATGSAAAAKSKPAEFVDDQLPVIVTIPDDPDGTSVVNVTAVVGRTFEVRIPGNPTTGYTWTLNKPPGDAVKSLGEPRYAQTPTVAKVAGSGGTFIFNFKAVEAGKAYAGFAYARPGEKITPPLRSAGVSFVIEDDLAPPPAKVAPPSAVKSDPTADAVKRLKANLDAFTLTAIYFSPEDRKTRILHFFVSTMGIKTPESSLVLRISKDEAGRLVDALAKDGFFATAEGPAARVDETHATCRIAIGGIEHYDMDAAVLPRLNALRAVLTGDAAKAMEQLRDREAGALK